MNYENLAAELVRAARGPLTQKALSEALGFRSNVLFAWENQRDFPRASLFFRLLRARGHDPATRLIRFRADARLDEPEDPIAVAAWLDGLRGNRTIVDVAEHSTRDRFALARIFHGKSEPRLPDFLELIETLTLSVLDFCALFVDPLDLPEARERWQKLEAARRAAYEFPWAQAIVVLSQLPAYRALPRHQPGWFASRLGLTIRQELECLELLVTLGRLAKIGERFAPANEALSVDTRRDPEQTRRLAAHWLGEAARRTGDGQKVRFGFNVFGISESDWGKLRELQSRYFAEMRALIAESEPTEIVAVANFALFEL